MKKLLKKIILPSILTGLLVNTPTAEAVPVLLDFEDIPDLTSVEDFYSSYGVHFNDAISLTAGFSLNEFDFPPSSGDVAIGDDWAPIEITFDNLTQDIYANFTYGSQLTFSAYAADSSLIGTYVHSGIENYGFSEQIALGFTGVSSLVIAGEWDGSFIMDDFGFNSNSTAPVPEPATIFLFSTGIAGLIGSSVRKKKIMS